MTSGVHPTKHLKIKINFFLSFQVEKLGTFLRQSRESILTYFIPIRNLKMFLTFVVDVREN